jgi:hypothetical protein
MDKRGTVRASKFRQTGLQLTAFDTSEALELLWIASGSESVGTNNPFCRDSIYDTEPSDFQRSWGWEQDNDATSANPVTADDELPELVQLFPPSVRRNGRSREPSGDTGIGSDQKWNKGRLMRLQGVDPNMFGWDDEEVCHCFRYSRTKAAILTCIQRNVGLTRKAELE